MREAGAVAAAAPRRTERLPRALIVAAFLAAVALSQSLVDPYRPLVNDESGVAFPLAAVVVRSFAGQVRGLLADFLWIRVDEYQHRRRIIGGEMMRGDDEALMPLVRLITWLNPHFIDAYALGGQWLAFHFNRPREAAALYAEGIRNNPRNVGLHLGLAWVHWRFLRDYPAAAREARAAGEAADEDDTLTRFQSLWLEAHIRMDEGNRAGAIAAWRALGRIPGYERTAAYWIKKVSASPDLPRVSPRAGTPGAPGLGTPERVPSGASPSPTRTTPLFPGYMP